ncbi:hypothetical protein Dtox_4259 [Desulfofarcimen acetoxidans DSM 771]|uniref:Uncharacterized protein n=1 Tax=Desulfofarcimen acetoxidans (strain ATCC 49208 / DSM 771 / KCTC 5769 / VKM B-1644 / 5575) TaxID=485916 RepID=C8VZI1_DESAS|nr:hypothetical protein [Desulfofarcimen acetoxidans]ACV64926.1 hypothetical protein Dtox_4259 [Desulfofarcimen acetoxidans DSM 771]
MNNKLKNLLDLLELINQQERIIIKQNEVIAKLINDTMEQENMINELMRDAVS